MIDRRTAIGAWVAGMVTLPRLAAAQAAGRVYRLGMLRPTAPPVSASDGMASAIPAALREMGFVEGRNLAIDARWAGGELDRLPALARELVQAKVDVIFAVGVPAVRAARDATAAIPIVMFGNFDPVALGLVASLAQPGGNVTGVLIAPDGTLAGKKLELLKLAVPTATRMAFLAPPDEPGIRMQVQETRVAALALGIDLPVIEVRGGDYARAFAAIAAQRAGALFVAAHTSTARDRAPIIALAAQHRLPAMYEWREQVADGGLMSYGSSQQFLYRRLAVYIDRIFKGANPAEMAVERPTKFELVINRKTARALGLTIPQSLLVRADEVIE